MLHFKITSTSWIYNIATNSMAAVRGHKYHILPTSSTPIIIATALLGFLLTLVFNFHGAGVNWSGFDEIIKGWIIGFYKYIFFAKTMSYFSLNFISENYTTIHIFWIAPFFISLGIFFLWSSNAISEGSSSKFSYLTILNTSDFLVAKFFLEPLYHTALVWRGFKIGFILFIISEIMFFFGFFWAFFHSSISPTIQIGAVWPPVDAEFITVKGFAIANTVILLTSGATLTLAHYAFELIPQKYTQVDSWAQSWFKSVESIEPWLEKFSISPKKIFFAMELYPLPFFKYLVQHNKFSPFTWLLHSVQIPLKTLLFPRPIWATLKGGVAEIEQTIKTYILLMLDVTLLLAFLFMGFQGTEYFISPVNIDSGIYGSTFYMITGLHGAHVFIGTCFLIYCWFAVAPLQNFWFLVLFFYELVIIICTLKIKWNEKLLWDFEALRQLNWEYFSDKHNNFHFEWNNTIDHYGKFGIESFESAAWYWHFVDVVWIFVFGFVYLWSHLTVLDQQ